MRCAVVTLFVALSLLGCRAAPKGAVAPLIPVTAFQLKAQTIPVQLEFVGVAKSSHPVEIRSRVEGYLFTIDYVEGSLVKENDKMFQIDPRPFQADLDEAKAELDRQEAILWRAKRSLERIEPLYKKNAASLRDLDNATAEVLAAEASVLAAQANVRKAALNLDYTKIIAPVTGLSGKASYREGSLITSAANEVMTLVSVLDPIWVYFSVSDNQLLQGRAERAEHRLILPKNTEYSVTLTLADGSTFPFQGQVDFTAPTLDPDTGTLTVRATFANPKAELLPGQFVSAHVSGALRPNALFVPQQSVYQGRSGMYVFVIDKDNKVASRSVEVGSWYKDYWIIHQGLKEGEIVIAEGVNKVQEGSMVKILSLSTP